jgi:plasmid stabilization system protein ParE
MLGLIARDTKIAEQGYRVLIINPYLVFYIVVTEERIIEIHRVLHEKRDYQSLF